VSPVGRNRPQCVALLHRFLGAEVQSQIISRLCAGSYKLGRFRHGAFSSHGLGTASAISPSLVPVMKMVPIVELARFSDVHATARISTLRVVSSLRGGFLRFRDFVFSSESRRTC
jgi:hypothetical protein